MECKKANDLMMKYMDQIITENEALLLRDHVSSCADCLEDFKIYDEMMTDFADIEIISAPEGFEESVALKIEESGFVYKPRNKFINNLLTNLIGGVAVIFAIGFIFIVNRDNIMNFMLTNDFLSSYMDIITPMTNLITTYTNNFIAAVSQFASSVAVFAAGNKYYILGAFIALLIAQYVILRRKENKVEDKVE